jgi:hypothetical protein
LFGEVSVPMTAIAKVTPSYLSFPPTVTIHLDIELPSATEFPSSPRDAATSFPNIR